MTSAIANTTAHAAIDTLAGETMGTTWCVKLVAPGASLHALHDGVQAQLDGVVAQMSTWEPESNLSRFNRAPAQSWNELPESFFEVLACALDIARASDGAFDPTIGPLVDAWGFGPSGRMGSPPDEATLAAMREKIGWRLIGMRPDTREVLQQGGIRIDLSGIAKGHAVDRVALHLQRQGVASALVEVGGELRGYGRKPDGGYWRVLMEHDPERDADAAPGVLRLDGCAVATSGDRWHRFEHAGTRYAHTMDPRTGRPAEHAPAAVTVVASDAMHADAWATALTVIGAEAGFAFANKLGLAARFVTRNGTGTDVVTTPVFDEHLDR